MTRNLPPAPDHVVSASLERGAGVLIDLTRKRYYVLNETAQVIWGAIERGLGREALLEQLLGAYDVPREAAERSLDRILDELADLGLLATEAR